MKHHLEKKQNYNIVIYADDENEVRKDNLTCSICNIPQKDYKDIVPMQQHGCCSLCLNFFGFGKTREQFLSGEWRPNQHQIDDYMKKYIKRINPDF